MIKIDQKGVTRIVFIFKKKCMKVRFISDLHFNHKSIATMRGFNSVEEMNEHIIGSWNSVVTNKKDITYILGDITMERKEGYELLDRLNGVKHVVLGNHDQRQHVPELLKYVSSVSGMINYEKEKGCLFSRVYRRGL